MKARKASRRKSRRRLGSVDRNGGMAILGTQLAAKLTQSWGPLLAFIAVLAVLGIVFTENAHSDITVLGIVVIVVVAIITALLARIRNVL